MHTPTRTGIAMTTAEVQGEQFQVPQDLASQAMMLSLAELCALEFPGLLKTSPVMPPLSPSEYSFFTPGF